MDKVIDYLEGKSVELPVSALDMSALTEFQRRVSETLIKHAPRGSALTYAELSALSGCPGGARAAGNVMANNPFPLFIPCHRVIKSGGAIGNYGPGPDLKRWLLEKEGFLAQNMA
jgi:methylated-DNA-[protein]-cysteine S-methyltransferase